MFVREGMSVDSSAVGTIAYGEEVLADQSREAQVSFPFIIDIPVIAVTSP